MHYLTLDRVWHCRYMNSVRHVHLSIQMNLAGHIENVNFSVSQIKFKFTDEMIILDLLKEKDISILAKQYHLAYFIALF